MVHHSILTCIILSSLSDFINISSLVTGSLRRAEQSNEGVVKVFLLKILQISQESTCVESLFELLREEGNSWSAKAKTRLLEQINCCQCAVTLFYSVAVTV